VGDPLNASNKRGFLKFYLFFIYLFIFLNYKDHQN
jgi:hypothetical protein